MTLNSREISTQQSDIVYMSPGFTRTWVIDGSTDLLDIQHEILAIAPALETVVDTNDEEVEVWLDRVHIEEAPGGGGVWTCKVTYASNADRTDLAFNFGVQTVKVYQSLDTILVYDCVDGGSGADGTLAGIPAFNGAIGVNGEKVEGAEIEVSKVEFTITKKWKQTELDSDYYQTLMQFTSPQTAVNDDTFEFTLLGQTLSYEKGSLRFRGAQTKTSSENESEIVYNFAYEKGITADDAFTVGNSASIVKEGWQYLWVFYDINVSQGTTIQRPKAAVVNQVYPYKDFNDLAIEE